jgi:phosphate uptake regulator
MPRQFLNWASSAGIEIPEELEAAIVRYGAEFADWQGEYKKLLKRHEDTVKEANRKYREMSAEKSKLEEEINQLDSSNAQQELTPRERSSLLKLILIMAVTKYRYRPGVKNKATGNNRDSISSDAEKLGLKIDNETIRNYLNESADMFSDDIILPDEE